ncbi:bifunctional [glutamine synthetase] adenylyltransferase/[glutamine synthetase]-adenylyl-L-tyrosine phosphorylase [Sphingomonas sp. ID0503]|uniref:bifunctional [glutamine synthetase] adenylyltransferase/[glutamine synthetase]-adenylyl-L-tyrosine phosphorylase n=1 Tax=Sphingomonas sp. ID0503 TaxID=3399691 RepID=UPI003AFA58F2
MQPPVTSPIAEALERAHRHAPFLAGLIDRLPTVSEALGFGGVAAALKASAGLAMEGAGTAQALRRERQGVALAVAIGDVAGVLPLEQVCAHLTDFADRALHRAIETAIAERTPDAQPAGFVAIALGKQGSRELNYSSDIDPILLFDPDTLPRRPREEPEEAAVRIARRVVELLQTRDADGYVLRVDLRLRPAPEATGLAVPVGGAISYYESLALPWERAAFIRARAAAGDVALGERFLSAIRPFVWRKALDFGAMGEITAISQRIRDHYSRGQALGPGFDLKRGRGGIREVEFFAQIHQLIHGGRDPSLRTPATLDALAALAAAGRIEPGEAERLTGAYRLYRTIEHRLQMVDDRQTHSLPESAEALDNVARLHGLDNGADLVTLLTPHVAEVGRIYDRLDPPKDGAVPQDTEGLHAFLTDLGFPDPAHAARLLTGWRAGRSAAARSPAAQAALEAVLPDLLPELGRAPDPQAAINRFDEMVARLPGTVSLFRLLDAQPAVREMLAVILSQAPALAEDLARRPALLDGLLDATALDLPPSVPDLVANWTRGEQGDDYQATLDRIRVAVGEARFALGAQIVTTTRDPIDAGAGYSRVAEAAVEVLATATTVEFERTHGRVPGGGLVILALGRLGGGILTHASDLDLVYLFTGDFAAESDGAKPLGATQYFNRLAQRVSAALSVPTASGPLYSVDTRLRPSGNQGLLAVSVDSFARYQSESAWTWEHMALTRARVIHGPPAARTEVEAVIGDTLRRPRDETALIADAVKMRRDVATHKPHSGDLDVKLVPGGLVDLEFRTHVEQLRSRKGLTPNLEEALAALIEEDLLPPTTIEDNRLLTRLLVTLRLIAPKSDEPPESARALVARACGAADWASLLAGYHAARQRVSAEWRTIVGEDDAERR